MRYIILHRTNAHWESGAIPTLELIQHVRTMVGELAQSGKLLAGDGLRPSALGVRLQFTGGTRTIQDGPFTESKELIAGFAIMKLKSIDEAIGWATQFAQVLGDLEIDIRPVTEAWDIGLGPKPAEVVTTRYMATHKHRGADGCVALTPAQGAEMGALMAEMERRGVLLSAVGLEPGSKGVCLRLSNGKPLVLDGPFAESKELLGGFVIVRDVGIAEELAQDALVAALEQWPKLGVPQKPGAWLMSVARNRAFDGFRRYRMMERRHRELGHELAEEPDLAARDREDQMHAELDDDVGDDLLRLIFTACHPVLSPDARVALTLRLLCSLTMEEIGRAYLMPEATISQRILRAKRTLAEARVPFEVPRAEELDLRLSSVLNVIYLVFNEGYSATAGEHWMRRALCDEAIRLGRVLAELMPAEQEVHGLVALMEIQASRADARVSPNGDPILLLEQNRAMWDQLLIRRGLAALDRAVALGGSLGPYTLQAAIAACHARALTATETDWVRIVALYDALAQLTPSPVIELNRAVAISMAFGPAVALELVDALVGEASLATYYLLPSVRGDLLFKLGRFEEARVEFDRAVELTRNGSERRLLLKRAESCQLGRE